MFASNIFTESSPGSIFNKPFFKRQVFSNYPAKTLYKYCCGSNKEFRDMAELALFRKSDPTFLKYQCKLLKLFIQRNPKQLLLSRSPNHLNELCDGITQLLKSPSSSVSLFDRLYALAVIAAIKKVALEINEDVFKQFLNNMLAAKHHDSNLNLTKAIYPLLSEHQVQALIDFIEQKLKVDDKNGHIRLNALSALNCLKDYLSPDQLVKPASMIHEFIVSQDWNKLPKNLKKLSAESFANYAHAMNQDQLLAIIEMMKTQFYSDSIDACVIGIQYLSAIASHLDAKFQLELIDTILNLIKNNPAKFSLSIFEKNEKNIYDFLKNILAASKLSKDQIEKIYNSLHTELIRCFDDLAPLYNEPGEESDEESMEEPDEELVAESIEEPMEELSEESDDELDEEPSEESAEESDEESAEEFDEESDDKLKEKLVKEENIKLFFNCLKTFAPFLSEKRLMEVSDFAFEKSFSMHEEVVVNARNCLTKIASLVSENQKTAWLTIIDQHLNDRTTNAITESFSGHLQHYNFIGNRALETLATIAPYVNTGRLEIYANKLKKMLSIICDENSEDARYPTHPTPLAILWALEIITPRLSQTTTKEIAELILDNLKKEAFTNNMISVLDCIKAITLNGIPLPPLFVTYLILIQQQTAYIELQIGIYQFLTSINYLATSEESRLLKQQFHNIAREPKLEEDVQAYFNIQFIHLCHLIVPTLDQRQMRILIDLMISRFDNANIRFNMLDTLAMALVQVQEPSDNKFKLTLSVNGNFYLQILQDALLTVNSVIYGNEEPLHKRPRLNPPVCR